MSAGYTAVMHPKKIFFKGALFMNCNNNCIGGGNCCWIIIILLVLFFCCGNNNNNCLSNC